MKNFLVNKTFNRLMLGLLLSLVLVGAPLFKASADSSVTPATGGTNISIDTTSYAGGSHTATALGDIVITEGAAGEISAGTHTFSLPDGWNFTTDTVTITTTNGTGMTIAVPLITPGATTLSFYVNTQSSSGPEIFSIKGVKVHPTGNATGSGNITMTAGTITGLDGSTNFGSLSTTAGTVTKLAFTTQPTTTVYGSTISSVVAKTQDQFGNNSVSSLAASKTVTIAKTSGSGTLSGTLTKDIGTGAGNGTVTFDDLTLSNVGAHVLNVSAAGLATATSDSFTMSQKTLTATMTVSNKTYDGGVTATITGRTPVGTVGGDTISLSGGTATFNNKNVATGKAVNATGITLGGADEAKYSYDGTAATTANITALQSTLGGSFTANNKTYDRGTTATVATNSLTLTSLVGGDSVTISPTIAFGNKTVANGKTVSITGASLGSTDGGNYTVDLTGAPTTTANITALQLGITGSFTPASKAYDGGTTATLDSNNIGLSGVISGDSVGFTWGSMDFDTKYVGTGKTVTVYIVLNDTDSGNYSLPVGGAITSSSGVITAKPLTIAGAFTAHDKTYDGSAAATASSSSLSLVGKVGAEEVTLTPALAFSDKNYGVGKTVSITAGSSLGGADAANYALSLAGATTTTANIAKRAITLNRTADTKVYDQTTSSNKIPTVSSGSLASGDAGVYSQTFLTKNVAPDIQLNVAVVSIKDASDDDMTGNYTVTLNHGMGGTITAKPVTVTGATVTTKTYDGNTTAAITGAVLSGIIQGDEVDLDNASSGTFSSANVAPSISVATAPMTLSDVDSGNYSLTQPTLTGAITAKEITIGGSFTANNKVYDNSNAATILVNSLTLPGKVGADDISLFNLSLVFSDKLVANGKTVSIASVGLTGTKAGNYSLSLSGAPTTTANITAKELTLDGTFSSFDKYYDETTTATINSNSLSLVGVVSPDAVGLTSIVLDFNSAAAAFGKTVNITSASLNGADASNYTLSLVGAPNTHGSNNILKATPTITWSSPSDIVAGTALSGTEFDATVAGVSGSLPGALVYSPATGTVLTTAGSHVLSTAFTPVDTTNYNDASATTSVVVVPAAINKLALSASPASLTVGGSSTITVTGKDQYDNVVTNNSSSITSLSTDNGGSLASSLLTLASGVKTTTLTNALAGVVNVNVTSGTLTPATTQVTFTSGAAPTVTAQTPTDNATGTAITITPTITFSGAMDAATLNGGTIQLRKYSDDTAVSATISYNPTSYVVTLTPSASLANNTQYYLWVSGAKNAGGTTVTDYTTKASQEFTTVAAGAAPTVTAQTPTDNATGTAITITPTITFSAAMDAATLNGGTIQLRKYSDDTAVSATISYNPTSYVVTLTPSASLANNTQYYLWVSGAKNAGGTTVTAYTTKANQEFTTATAGTGSFGIVSTTMTKMTGTADNSFANGWEWVIRMTLPTNQNHVALKFNDWVSGSNTLATANNMQYYSEQISSGTGSAAVPVTITAASTYPSNITVSTDVDPSTPGIQTDIHVQVKIPASTANGSYSTSYRVNYE